MEPKIRYNGYIKEWDNVCLNDIVSNAGVKNRENLPLVSFSITNDQGFIPQDDKFENGGTMRDANKSMYYIVSPKTFAYNPARINVGSIGYYDLEKNVIISSLYVVFKTDQEKCDDYYFLQWFKSDKFKRLIEQYQEGGVRLYFFYDKLCKCHIHIPSKEEQHKISSYFKVFDAKLQASTKKLESLKKLKSASLVAMFPQNGESTPKVRFMGFKEEWETVRFGSLITECLERSITENEDVLLSSAITGMYLNSELFGHQRGKSNIGYRKIKRNMLVLSAQNLHLGNANVNLRFEHGLVSPAYKIYTLNDIDPVFLAYWVKLDLTKDFFARASTEGASLCRKNIVWEELYKQTLQIPTNKDEQQTIGDFFRSLDRKIALETARLEKLKQIKLACLDKMFV